MVGGAIGVVSLGDSGDDLDVAADDTGAAVSDDGDTGDGGTNGGEGADETAETAEARRESDDVASTTAVGRFFEANSPAAQTGCSPGTAASLPSVNASCPPTRSS